LGDLLRITLGSFENLVGFFSSFLHHIFNLVLGFGGLFYHLALSPGEQLTDTVAEITQGR